MSTSSSLASLIGIRAGRRSKPGRRGVGAREIAAGIGLLVSIAAFRLGRGRWSRHAPGPRLSPAHRAITVHCSQEEAYRFWRDFENLPRVLTLLESVQAIDAGRSRWLWKGPAGLAAEWDVEIIDDRPNESVAWRTRDRADRVCTGALHLVPAPGGRGVEVHLEMLVQPKSTLGEAAGKLVGAALGEHLCGALRRFKQLMETGDIVQSDASVHRGPHPAQPDGEARRAGNGGGERAGWARPDLSAHAQGGAR
jgi:uncharacterized membrane protein